MIGPASKQEALKKQGGKPIGSPPWACWQR